MAQYKNDYPVRASHALSPGNVQDAASVVRSDIVFEGNFGGGGGRESYYWTEVFTSDGMMKAEAMA